MLEKALNFGRGLVEKSKKLVVAVVATVAVCFTGVVHAAGEGLAIVAQDGTSGAITFAPEALASPIIDAAIATAKWGALVALVFIGIYIIVKMFKGK